MKNGILSGQKCIYFFLAGNTYTTQIHANYKNRGGSSSVNKSLEYKIFYIPMASLKYVHHSNPDILIRLYVFNLKSKINSQNSDHKI